MPKNGSQYVSPYVVRFMKQFGTQLSTSTRVLDLGSGYFRHADFFRRIGLRDITCVDKLIFPARPVGVQFEQRDLELGIPWAPIAAYDLIICTHLLMFIQNREQLLDEITRVAAPGAHLVLEVHLRNLAFGLPITLDPLVARLVLDGRWRVIDQLRYANKQGAVLFRIS